eukprot:1753266-Ditylum_brightwellii.AAC.1
MASTKKSNWKLMMDGLFGHTQIRSVIRAEQLQQIKGKDQMNKAKACVKDGDKLEGTKGKLRNRVILK